MAVIHDLICDRCGEILDDVPSTVIGSKCAYCMKGRMEIYYGNWGRREKATPLDAKDATVVYEHPVTGKVVYPARNDIPMPERYRAAGFERVEMRTLNAIDRFSEKHGLVNEAAHYDRGSGRSYDTERGRR